MSKVKSFAMFVGVVVALAGVGAIADINKKCVTATTPPSGCSDISCGASPCTGAASAKKNYEGAGKCTDNPETECDMERTDPYCCATTCGYNLPNCVGGLACWSSHFTTLDCTGDF